MAKKLSQWDQKDWKKRLILGAAHVNALGNSVVLMKEVQASNKPKIISLATDVITGLNTVYEVFLKAYTEAEGGMSPGDFTGSITSPGAPPVPPASTAESVLWFQAAWSNMKIVLNRVGQKCPKVASVMEGESLLGGAAENLCTELMQAFGDASENAIRYRSMATFNAVNFPEKFPEN